MQYNYRSKFVSIYKYDKYIFAEPFRSFQPKYIFIGKSKVCPMTEFSGAADNSSNFEGNTLLLEFENNEYIYIKGLEIIKIKTDDKILDYISLMGNNKTPYAFATGQKYTYFIYNRYNFFENDKIEEGTLLNGTYGSLDPFDYHREKCGIDSFKSLEHTRIHIFLAT